jgi:hypothetical protein
VAPLQSLVDEDLADAAPLDRDTPLLVEVGPQAVERPAAEGEVQPLRVGQRRGDDLGALLGGVGVRPAGAGPVLQAAEALLVEATDPGVDGGPAGAQVAGDLAGASPVGEGDEEPGPLDESGLGGARVSELVEGLTFLRGEWSQRHFGVVHGCTSLLTKATPVLRRAGGVSSLAGCTT